MTHYSTDVVLLEAECVDRLHPNSSLGDEIFLYYRIFLDSFSFIATFVTNTVLILAITLYRREHKGSVKIYNTSSSMMFVINLAVSDLLMGVSVTTYLATNYCCALNDVFRTTSFLCLTRYVPSCFCQIVSSLSLIAIAVDRYVAVFHSFRYKAIMTTRTCYFIIAAVWGFSFLCSGVLYFWNSWEEGSLCSSEEVLPKGFVIVLDSVFHFTVLAMVGGIHYKLHRKACQSNSQRSSLGIISPEMPNNIKSARVLGLVVGVYFFCWTPYCITNIMDMVEEGETSFVHYGVRIAYTLRNTYSFINPFIYAWRNREIQSAVRWYICKTFTLS